ncbi:MAG: 4Fe-4S dicluster domain-containing protein, partial [Deltaproteobacteria bacterium]|nr:4Fe-4S dicluster domain-containing protein [Deltaproteobacteria bacterium]
MDIIQKEMSRDRRAFIKNVLSGTIAGSLLLVIPAGAMDLG